jgi:hypothetical protein
VATAAAIGGAGLVVATPAAALLASPGEAHAAPPVDLFGCVVAPFGSSCLSPDNVALAASLTGGLALADPFLDLAGAIPVVNVFIGNGADGTAAHPNGFNGGLLIGSGGDGYSPTTPGAHGGNGGNGGGGGSGGAGGTGGDGSSAQGGKAGGTGADGSP